MREAFKLRGWDAWSVDWEETEIPGQHYVGDVEDVIGDGWDMMIAFLPCTYLSNAGRRVWNEPGRYEKRIAAMEFFSFLYNVPIEKVCIENPLGVPCWSFRKPDQIIHPYYFGGTQKKKTCLWLKGLKPLNHIAESERFKLRRCILEPKPIYIASDGKGVNFTEAHHGSKQRSWTLPEIVRAMAHQWT